VRSAPHRLPQHREAALTGREARLAGVEILALLIGNEVVDRSGMEARLRLRLDAGEIDPAPKVSVTPFQSFAGDMDEAVGGALLELPAPRRLLRHNLFALLDLNTHPPLKLLQLGFQRTDLELASLPRSLARSKKPEGRG